MKFLPVTRPRDIAPTVFKPARPAIMIRNDEPVNVPLRRGDCVVGQFQLAAIANDHRTPPAARELLERIAAAMAGAL